MDEVLNSTALERARTVIRNAGRVVVAFSGGVDSTFVLRVACDVSPGKVLAVTGRSPSVPSWELREATELAESFGAPHRIVETHELENPDYAKNDSNRCYFCKSELFDTLEKIRLEVGYDAILDGTNLDDLQDHRPGMKARRERAIRSPLVEAEITKAEIREASRALGLSTADKPSFACLASRFPYGTPVTLDGLRQVEKAEEGVRNLGFRQFRVRHHGDVARLELGVNEMARVQDEQTRLDLVSALKGAGYRFVALDLEGYRTGSLNEVLPAAILSRSAALTPRSGADTVKSTRKGK